MIDYAEVYGAITLGRKAVGMELKPSYYRQALRNLEIAGQEAGKQEGLLI